MRIDPNDPFRWIARLAVLILVISLAACQTGGPAAVEGGSAATPAAEQQAAGPDSNLGRPDDTPEGDLDLADPTVGLDQLAGFRQHYSQTLKGNLQSSPYEEVQTIAREVVNGDESIQVNENKTGSDAVYLFTARLGDYRYAQEQEGASCRAEPAQTGEGMDRNPAVGLPAAFGMQEAGREELDGRAAVLYTFNETSLYDPQGMVDEATGEVWLADGSGIVLQYELTVEINTPDFTGTRIWSYQLSPVEPDDSIRLPGSCQPVLADLPTLPGAADLELLPGFQRYFAQAARSEAVEFYHDRLSTLGWEALPGSSPDTADLESAATVLSFAQAYHEGGRILVIQLSEYEDRLQVIAQTALTKKPVQSNVSAEPGEQPEDGEETTDTERPSTGSAVLPADLPAYPGAAIVSEIEAFRLLSIEAPAREVIEFYIEELEGLGWTLDQQVEGGGTTLLLLFRGDESLSLTISEVEAGGTQVLLSADAN